MKHGPEEESDVMFYKANSAFDVNLMHLNISGTEVTFHLNRLTVERGLRLFRS